MADSAIEWTEKVWNPVRGCDIYSEECTNCYAMRQAHRFAAPGGKYAGLTKLTKGGPVWIGAVREHHEQLDAPRHWRAGCLVFVNSMSDLFYGDEADARRAVKRGLPFKPVSPEFVRSCFAVMAECPQHTFQVLTKRPDRMWAVLDQLGLSPLPNVLIGCSVGKQSWADLRLESMLLLHTRGWRTWVSYEPALGPVNWAGWEFIRWLVAGEESGYGRRRADLAWFYEAASWAHKAGVCFFMKQLLSGRTKVPYMSFPQALQVRQYPEAPRAG